MFIEKLEDLKIDLSVGGHHIIDIALNQSGSLLYIVLEAVCLESGTLEGLYCIYLLTSGQFMIAEMLEKSSIANKEEHFQAAPWAMLCPKECLQSLHFSVHLICKLPVDWFNVLTRDNAQPN